jgi:hypothetical protein
MSGEILIALVDPHDLLKVLSLISSWIGYNLGSAKGAEVCHEKECLESVDRDSFYHLPVLFQPLDGSVQALGHWGREGYSLGNQGYLYGYEL